LTNFQKSIIINTEIKERGNSTMKKYIVINPDNTVAGVPCDTYEEARELASQREGRTIAEVKGE
jgi:hypothetical protein